MPFDLETLFSLLPAYLRTGDAGISKDPNYPSGPLHDLLALVAESAAVLEEDLAALYADQFIETADPWAVPYIGDLIGYRPLNSLSRASLPEEIRRLLSERAQVANTIAYRRRKGTAAVLERLARDVTGWDALAVEYFQRLAVTQNANHIRPGCQTANLRGMAGRGGVTSPFNGTARSGEVRSISTGEGKYNIPNVGIFAWRWMTFAVSLQPAFPGPAGDHDFFFSPLGMDLPLFHPPLPVDTAVQRAGPRNVPGAITRRQLHDDLQGAAPLLYGSGGSLQIFADGLPVPAEKIRAADLSDDPVTHAWAHHPQDAYALDPELGRLTTPAGAPAPGRLEVFYHFASPSEIGTVLGQADLPELPHGTQVVKVPSGQASIAAAQNAASALPSVEIQLEGSPILSAVPDLEAAAGQFLALRAEPGQRPTLQPGADWNLGGGPDSEILLEGLLISGGALVLPELLDPAAGRPNQLGRLHLRRCTLAPRPALNPDGTPRTPAPAGLVILAPGCSVVLEDCITGPIFMHPDAHLELRGTICDAGDSQAVAIAGPDQASYGGTLAADACTVIGRVHVYAFDTVTSAIFASRFPIKGRWPKIKSGRGTTAPVRSERRQVGCINFSFVPWGSYVPRTYACHPENPDEAARLWPRFISADFGQPAYAMLAGDNPAAIWRGGEEESSPGAYHDLYEPQRLANLGIRLDEYLRFGLEACIFLQP